MNNNEPYFMKKIHEQREKDSRVLYSEFNGNVDKWLDWMKQKNNNTHRFMVRDASEKGYQVNK